MTIGVLKEGDGENRVVFLPEHVAILVKMEFAVLVEKGAGDAAFSSDKNYVEAGASIRSRAGILNDADMLFSIHPPKEAISKGKILILLSEKNKHAKNQEEEHTDYGKKQET